VGCFCYIIEINENKNLGPVEGHQLIYIEPWKG